REAGTTNWLGREGSNLRMAESKSAALPLGYAPTAGPETAGFWPRADSLWQRRSIGGVRPFQPAGGPNFGKPGGYAFAMYNNAFRAASSGARGAVPGGKSPLLPASSRARS